MRKRERAGALCCVLLLTLTAAGQTGSVREADRALAQRLSQRIGGFRGKVALYAEQLNTGRVIAIDADRPVQTASVIKLGILYEAMKQVRSGKVTWERKVMLQPGDAVSGSGVLTFFDAPLQLTLKDVLSMMVIVSDNTATNLAIDVLGLDAVNARLEVLGLRNTHLYKKVMKPATEPMPADQPKFGLGKTTAREMAELMSRIGRCELDNPGAPAAATAAQTIAPKDVAICEVGLTMLRNQFYRDTIPRFLEGVDTSETGSAIASKTGSLDAVRNDVAIVAGRSGPMVLAIFTFDNQDKSWTNDNEGERMIADAAREIVKTWSPEGIDGKDLRPGLGLGGTAGQAGASK